MSKLYLKTVTFRREARIKEIKDTIKQQRDYNNIYEEVEHLLQEFSISLSALVLYLKRNPENRDLISNRFFQLVEENDFPNFPIFHTVETLNEGLWFLSFLFEQKPALSEQIYQKYFLYIEENPLALNSIGLMNNCLTVLLKNKSGWLPKEKIVNILHYLSGEEIVFTHSFLFLLYYLFTDHLNELKDILTEKLFENLTTHIGLPFYALKEQELMFDIIITCTYQENIPIWRWFSLPSLFDHIFHCLKFVDPEEAIIERCFYTIINLISCIGPKAFWTPSHIIEQIARHVFIKEKNISAVEAFIHSILWLEKEDFSLMLTLKTYSIVEVILEIIEQFEYESEISKLSLELLNEMIEEKSISKFIRFELMNTKCKVLERFENGQLFLDIHKIIFMCISITLNKDKCK